MYDDVANDPENPYRGKIINRPAGPDVYKGVPKDYTGENVTKENLLAVLRGDKAAAKGKKVLESGPNDQVFIYYSGTGYSDFIDLIGVDIIRSEDLIAVIEDMYQRKMYGKMLIYVDADYAGSLFFEGQLRADRNVFAVASALFDQDEASAYCPGDPGVPEEVNTCLGDQFSVAWMEEADRTGGRDETIKDHLKKVSRRVTSSEVDHFGDQTIGELQLKEFIGEQVAA